jgi:hypothetical protein
VCICFWEESVSIDRNKSCALAVVALGLAISAFAQEPALQAPGGFVFDGVWACSGSFVRNGKPHRSTYEGRSVPGSTWIELVETDIEPKGYVGRYMIGYDSGKKQLFELDANNAGYAIYTSPGWQDRSLILTSTETVSYSVPKNRFVFHTTSPDTFDVAWETETGSGWAAADRLSCERGDRTGVASGALAASVYFEPRLQSGQKLSNVFSRTIAYRGEGVDDLVRRISGTANYTVTNSSPEKLVFDSTGLYDGRPEYKGNIEIRDKGRTTCYDGQCSTATDASGLLFNALLWGDPGGNISKGSSWEMTIAEPWELGPPGKQTVTVVSADPTTHSVTLRREGTGGGGTLVGTFNFTGQRVTVP